MSNSLRDQLLGLGYKPAIEAERKPGPARQQTANSAPRPPIEQTRVRPATTRATVRKHDRPVSAVTKHSAQEIDLAKAYALRSQIETSERIEAERLKQEEARLRREAKAKLADLLKDQALNDPTAEMPRHFEYGGKIKRVYVTAEQLKALNAGQLGVAQFNGRYLLITATLLAEVATIYPAAVALQVDPDAPAADDSALPVEIPDDLVW